MIGPGVPGLGGKNPERERPDEIKADVTSEAVSAESAAVSEGKVEVEPTEAPGETEATVQHRLNIAGLEHPVPETVASAQNPVQEFDPRIIEDIPATVDKAAAENSQIGVEGGGIPENEL